jgi:chemosensory pili system protein ChpA (sensor histidine kinase/response regulator)
MNEQGASAGTRSPLLDQLLEVFLEEAAEMLDILHGALEILERASSREAVIEARRTVHTIKGGARMCGLTALTGVAHACEDMIGQASAEQDSLAPAMVALLFEAEQAMRAALAQPTRGIGSEESLVALAARLRALRSLGQEPGAALPPPPETVPEGRAETAAEGAAPSPEPLLPTPARQPVPLRLHEQSSLLHRPAFATPVPSNRLAVDLSKVEDMVARVTEIVANRAASRSLVDTLSSTVMEMQRTSKRLQEIAAGLHHHISALGLDSVVTDDPDELGLETYGPIPQLLLQLQEATSDQQALVQAGMNVVTNQQALAVLESRLDTELQAALLQMRLLPLNQLRVRLDQVVRSAVTAGREVRWVMEDQHVALDKQVCDRLFEPLMHLLRNAIDHGIEHPAEREARGKPRTGHIVVQAVTEGNQAVITVSDDGRGIDPEKIAETAVRRGIITAEQAAALSQREKQDLIFRPGFSTATTVTELSGRGMGMEIVRETCMRMGGSVSIGERAGGGTTVTLNVPLSLSVIPALLVRDDNAILAVPASQVFFVQLGQPGDIVKRGGNFMARVGQNSRAEVPLFHLRRTQNDPSSLLRGERTYSFLVVPYRGERVAIIVDDVLDEQELIVKPLPLLLQGVERLLGAVVLGDGVPAPVLNLPPLLEYMTRERVQMARPAPVRLEKPTVLVVDDSVTMRTALMQSLKHAGFNVLPARDGQEALEIIRTNGLPSLITLDIEMPRMDGLETLYAIRHMEGGELLPIFMLTSRTGQSHRRTAMKMGATRYFTKPYNDSEFIGAIQEATRQRLYALA